MNYASLVKAIQSATSQLQGRVATVANQALVLRNWLVGADLIEFEQNGKERAKYGDGLLERVAKDMLRAGTTGLHARVLRTCRQVYLIYPQIRLTLSAESTASLLDPVRRTVSRDLALQIPVTASPKSKSSIRPTPSAELPTPLSPEALLHLSWSKLVELIAIDDPWKRAFFENECIKANWSVRQLRRQIGSLLYERTGLSTNKKAVIERARKQEPQQTIADLIHDPYVLEFTGLAERPEYLESDLESALLTHLQSFLLELGVGFCFEARQKRITVGGQHDYIDLVFYHRRLRCHVLIDLKIRPFKHGDAGQMNFYLNWWKAHGMEEGDNPPVGIILCSDRDQSAVEFATAGMDPQLFISRYLVALPSTEKIRAFLEADRDQIESLMAPASAKKPAHRKKTR
jgi:predicted nuclease of restriction endonuclease-like (RecB) superfamily